jgi:hypothetical protein
MKNLLILTCILLGINTNAQELKRYAIKSGYIKLELTGNISGTREVWWDNYGSKTHELEKSSSVTKVFGIKTEEKTHTLTIHSDGEYWIRDYIEGTGSKGKIYGYEQSKSLANSMNDQEREQFGRQMLESMGGQIEGKEKVGNYNCEVVSLMGAKTWVYKGVTLKSETSIMGITANEKFTEFKPNASVSSAKFVAPSDVNYEDQSANMQGMWGQSMLVDGDDMLYDDDESMVPVEYPFDKFKQVVDGFSYQDYRCAGTHSMEGVHAANFMKGMKAIMVVATSRKNAEPGEHDSFESFTANGHKCYYGDMEDDEGTALVIDYPKYDMYITIVGVPDLSKSELLEIEKKMQF